MNTTHFVACITCMYMYKTIVIIGYAQCNVCIQVKMSNLGGQIFDREYEVIQ